MTEEKRPIELEIKEALEIHPEDITGDLQRHPSLYFYWGSMWVRASRAVRKQKLALKELDARLVNDLRSREAKVTEAMRNDYLNQHPDHLAAEQALIQAEYMEEMLDVARYGFTARGQALQELSRANRAEEIYGSEFKAMQNEFDEREKDKKKKRGVKQGGEVTESIPSGTI